jgi:hypothetical protein
VPVDALFATERREPVPARDGKLWEPVGPERPNGTRVSRVGLSSGELAKAEIVKARLVADGSALFQREGGASGRLERAWSTPWLQGPRAQVFLLRKASDWCLSLPDPAPSQPGDRGVGCSLDSEFRRFGISNAEGGLVAIYNVAPGSAISLHDRSGARRTDSFPEPVARNLHHCSDGTMRLIPASRSIDPCVPVG